VVLLQRQDLAGGVGLVVPLELTEAQRRFFASRLMLQLPAGVPPRELASVRRDMDRVVKGLPGDVFMALDALRLLADQGNAIAADLFDVESRRLGLTRPLTSYRK
jgi:hypothetical protein